MYIFMLAYPLLMFYILRVLGLFSNNNILSYIKHMGVFWILPIPIVVLIERMIRSIAETTLSVDYAIMQFIELTLLPAMMFLYIFYFVRTKLLIENNRSKEGARNIQNDGKVYYNALSEYIVFIPLLNYFCITISNIIINNTYFNWIDILLYPLMRMAMTQILIVLIAIVMHFQSHKKEPHSQSYKQYKVYYICIGIYIAFGLVCAFIIMVSRNESILLGGMMSMVIVALGYVLMVVHSLYNKKAKALQ